MRALIKVLESEMQKQTDMRDYVEQEMTGHGSCLDMGGIAGRYLLSPGSLRMALLPMVGVRLADSLQLPVSSGHLVEAMCFPGQPYLVT